MPTTVHVTVDEAEIAALKRDPGIGREVQRIMDGLADASRRTAPRKTGRGAAGIRGYADLRAGEWVGWVGAADPYMLILSSGFTHVGGKEIPADPFFVEAIDQYSTGG